MMEIKRERIKGEKRKKSEGKVKYLTVYSLLVTIMIVPDIG